MVLDAVLVGVLRWGVFGAALATGISQTDWRLASFYLFYSSK